MLGLMKTIKMLFYTSLLISSAMFAQYDDYNSGTKYGGVNKDIGRDYSTPSKPSAAETEKAKAAQIDKIIALFNIFTTSKISEWVSRR